MAFHPVREWFGAKRVGWGISPHTWEGWVATFLIAAALIAVFTWAIQWAGSTIFAVPGSP